MIVIETCPKCGHDLHDVIITTYPPILKKECFSCGWSWIEEREQIVRVPFGGNSTNITNTTEQLSLNDCLNSFNQKDSLVGNFEQSACIGCSNNLKNGGSGICHCTLGQIKIT